MTTRGNIRQQNGERRLRHARWATPADGCRNDYIGMFAVVIVSVIVCTIIWARS